VILFSLEDDSVRCSGPFVKRRGEKVAKFAKDANLDVERASACRNHEFIAVCARVAHRMRVSNKAANELNWVFVVFHCRANVVGIA
jgi:hypothetical protein